MFRVCRRRRCCVVDWGRDWNHRGPVKKTPLASGSKRRGASVAKKREKSGVLLKESLLLAPGFMHQGDGVQAENAKESMSQRTKDGTISNVVASTESLNLRSWRSECEGSIFSSSQCACYCEILYFFWLSFESKLRTCRKKEKWLKSSRYRRDYRDWTLCWFSFNLSCT